MSKKSKNCQNPELQKQIGCVYGFFRFFDRHHFLPGRRISSHNHKSLPPGKFSNDTRELNSRSQEAEEKNSKPGDEKDHFFVESYTTSASSSRSSSFSSLEFSKAIQSDTHCSCQTKFLESPIQTSVIKEPATSNLQCCSVHETVKDSICRKSLVLSVGAAEGHFGHPKKYIDSPRPPRHKRSVSNGDAAVNNDSFLSRVGEVSRHCNGLKDDYVPLPPKDMARHSYDGMNIQFRSIMKLKELPRLSLDSKERMIKGSSNCKGDYLSKESDRQQTPRTPSVIEKLMGMDTSPVLGSIPETPSSRSTDKREESRTSGSVCNSGRETNLYKVRSIDKAILAIKDATNPQEPVSKGKECPTAPSSPISVYGEIEKRLTTLEFKSSGKDLRALKHILDAMQKSKDSMNIKRYETSDSTVCMDKTGNLNERSKLSSNPSKQLIESPNSKSGIIIKKAAKMTRKTSHHATPGFSAGETLGANRSHANVSANNVSISKQAASSLAHRRTCKSQSLRDRSITTKATKLMSTVKVSQDMTEEKNTSPVRIARTQSERSRKEQFPKVKISCLSNSLSDSSMYRKKSVKAIEPSSPSTSGRQKSPNLHEGPNQFSKTRKLYSHGDDNISMKVNNLKILASLQNNEERINAYGGPTNKESAVKPATTTSEQPSPVSVLDATYYKDDPPSPIKTKSISFKEDNSLNPHNVEQNSAGICHYQNSTQAGPDMQIDYGKSNETNHSSQDSKVNNSRNQEFISNVMVAICRRKNPQEKSVQEVLSTSVLLGGSEYGDLINSDFLLELEKKATKGYLGIKESYMKVEETNYIKQMHRKLIFDVAFDLLVQRGVLESTSWQCLSPTRAVREPKGQQLLAEVCSEIDRLQSDNRTSSPDHDEKFTTLLARDLEHHSEKWTRGVTEVSETILAVERLIFKDLITEIVNGDNC